MVPLIRSLDYSSERTISKPTAHSSLDSRPYKSSALELLLVKLSCLLVPSPRLLEHIFRSRYIYSWASNISICLTVSVEMGSLHPGWPITYHVALVALKLMETLLPQTLMDWNFKHKTSTFIFLEPHILVALVMSLSPALYGQLHVLPAQVHTAFSTLKPCSFSPGLCFFPSMWLQPGLLPIWLYRTGS